MPTVFHTHILLLYIIFAVVQSRARPHPATAIFPFAKIPLTKKMFLFFSLYIHCFLPREVRIRAPTILPENGKGNRKKQKKNIRQSVTSRIKGPGRRRRNINTTILKRERRRAAEEITKRKILNSGGASGQVCER